ncbi:hypothetical protein QQZ08_000330 [Neonectria magnoliae]|uniref:NADP-dependent oxidoreductase domain-containing protein n=1 Tax=Neonectria magnoliae TaxID=2732573 RepID=A0ABR1IK03_9HYPO
MGLSQAMGTQLSTEEAEPVLQKAVDLGYTFCDTVASIQAFPKHNIRDKLFIASKCGFDVFGGDGHVTNFASHITKYLEGTTERLGSVPDLYYLHRIDPNTPLEESIGTLDKLRKEGNVKYIGLSECSVETLRKANSIAKIDAVKSEYSAFETIYETNGVIDTAKELGVAFVAFSPLGHG